MDSAPAVAPVGRAPVGFQLLLDAGTPATGTELYTANGKLIGTVSSYETNHTFPNGVPAGPAYLIQSKAGAEPTWLSASLVNATYYVKK